VDECAGNSSLLNRGNEGRSIGLGIWHLNVETSVRSFGAVVNAIKEIGHDEAAKAPFVLENFAQEVGIFAGIVAADTVVSGHHGGNAGIDDALEVRKVDFAESTLVDVDVKLGAVHFDGVQGKVFGAGHDVVALYTFERGDGHLAKKVRILTESFLSAAPARVAQKIQAQAAVEVAVPRANLLAHGITDAAFQVEVPRSAARHGHGKASGVMQDDATRAIGESHGRDLQPRITAGKNRGIVVFQPVQDYEFR